MKLRLKFEKTGVSRFVGHLDVMRYFQKLNRRAGLDVAYTEGFSPHQRMAFATPLGMGLSSRAEYVDIEAHSVPAKEELLQKYRTCGLEDFRVVDACLLPEKAENAMSLLAAADYFVSLRPGHEPADKEAYLTGFFRFFEAEHVTAVKETKKGSREVDLKPMIHELSRQGDGVFMKIDTGSASNLKPELLFETYEKAAGIAPDPFRLEIERRELYGRENGAFKALIDYGSREF